MTDAATDFIVVVFLCFLYYNPDNVYKIQNFKQSFGLTLDLQLTLKEEKMCVTR